MKAERLAVRKALSAIEGQTGGIVVSVSTRTRDSSYVVPYSVPPPSDTSSSCSSSVVGYNFDDDGSSVYDYLDSERKESSSPEEHGQDKEDEEEDEESRAQQQSPEVSPLPPTQPSSVQNSPRALYRLHKSFSDLSSAAPTATTTPPGSVGGDEEKESSDQSPPIHPHNSVLVVPSSASSSTRNSRRNQRRKQLSDLTGFSTIHHSTSFQMSTENANANKPLSVNSSKGGLSNLNISIGIGHNLGRRYHHGRSLQHPDIADPSSNNAKAILNNAASITTTITTSITTNKSYAVNSRSSSSPNLLPNSSQTPLLSQHLQYHHQAHKQTHRMQLQQHNHNTNNDHFHAPTDTVPYHNHSYATSNIIPITQNHPHHHHQKHHHRSLSEVSDVTSASASPPVHLNHSSSFPSTSNPHYGSITYNHNHDSTAPLSNFYYVPLSDSNNRQQLPSAPSPPSPMLHHVNSSISIHSEDGTRSCRNNKRSTRRNNLPTSIPSFSSSIKHKAMRLTEHQMQIKARNQDATTHFREGRFQDSLDLFLQSLASARRDYQELEMVSTMGRSQGGGSGEEDIEEEEEDVENDDIVFTVRECVTCALVLLETLNSLAVVYWRGGGTKLQLDSARTLLEEAMQVVRTTSTLLLGRGGAWELDEERNDFDTRDSNSKYRHNRNKSKVNNETSIGLHKVWKKMQRTKSCMNFTAPTPSRVQNNTVNTNLPLKPNRRMSPFIKMLSLAKAHTLTNKGIINMMTEEYKMAAQLFGSSLVLLNRNKDATPSYSKRFLQVMGYLSKCLMEEGMMKEAINIQKMVVQTNRSDVTLLQFGHLRMKNGDYTTALGTYQEALRIYNSNHTSNETIDKAMILHFIGRAQYKLGKYKTAKEMYDEVLKVYSDEGLKDRHKIMAALLKDRAEVLMNLWRTDTEKFDRIHRPHVVTTQETRKLIKNTTSSFFAKR